MTKEQYNEVCKIFGKELTEQELKEMGMTAVDGVFDEEIDYDIGLYKFEEYKRYLWEKKEK